MLATPYTTDVYRLLDAVGVRIEPPFSLRYQWPDSFLPFMAQKVTGSMLTIHPRAYVLNGMGTGKTAATIAAANWLMEHGIIERAVIAAPLSTLSLVWGKELFNLVPDKKFVILHGPAKKRRELVNDMDARFYIINHDGVQICMDQFMDRPDINLLIIDELAEYRTKKTRRWQVLDRVAQCCSHVWGLTGTPMPNYPTDVWAQCKLVTPWRAPQFFRAFRDDTMVKISDTKWAPKEGALDRAFDLLQPGIRFRREDCTDMPPITTSDRSIELSPKATKAYRDMARHLKHEAQSGEITAANEGVKLNKLLQISCGYVYTDDQTVEYLDPLPRLRVVDELIREAPAKVLVFVPFVHAIKDTVRYLRKAGHSVELIYGDTKKADRDDICGRFQNAQDPRVLVAHPRTMAHGLNLTAATVAIWFSPTTSSNQKEQADNRMPRPGQVHPMHIVHLVGTEAERRTYLRLRNKQTMQGILLEMFEG